MPPRTSSSTRSFWLTLLVLTVLANLCAAWLSMLRWNELGVDLTRSVWGILAAAYLATMAVCLLLLARVVRAGDRTAAGSALFRFLEEDRWALRVLGWVVSSAILLLIPYLKFTFRIGRSDPSPLTDAVLLSIVYYWLCWYLLLLAGGAVKLALHSSWQVGFLAAMVLLGLTYEILLRLNAVTTYPLSMGWSEGSRYYYASLYFSSRLYGESVPLSSLHPSRYLLQSIPFLIPEAGIAIHRFWQFLLWIGLTAGATLALAGRAFPAADIWAKRLFAAWAFLFLLRVGVYYHLELAVIVPLLLVRPKQPWRSLLAVGLASAWAGISRVNWFPVPAMIAIAIYLLETPLRPPAGSGPVTARQAARYFTQPALWAVTGLLAALAAQAAYIFLSGNARNADAFASSFTSDLLWYRLWPNPNHFLGILPAILIVTGPLIVVLILAYRRGRSLHPLRWLALSAMIGILFVGSLVVSIKIGGGGDLHNMDAYAILIVIAAAYAVGGCARAEPGGPPLRIESWPTFTVAALIPVLFLVPLLSPYPAYATEKNRAAYRQLTQIVNRLGQQGPVLLINERQLVTFGDVHIPLVSDYEAVTLMEMAMANNQTYLNRFYDDLKSHRFAAIVAARQNLVIKQSGALVEENNVWNSRVSPYILCYYRPVATIEPQGNRLEVYVPSAEPAVCPGE